MQRPLPQHLFLAETSAHLSSRVHLADIMPLDEGITDLIRKYCHVSAHGILSWRGRCYGALLDFIDIMGCEDRASAAERCRNISDDSHVIDTLQDLFEEFSPTGATVQSWQAIADAATLAVPHRPLRGSSSTLLTSIKARRGVPSPQVVPPTRAPVMHPRDRATRGLDVASDAATVADFEAAAPPAADPAEPAAGLEVMSHTQLLKQLSHATTRLATARKDAQSHKRRADLLERQLAKEVRAKEHAQTALERFSYSTQPKRVRKHHRDARVAPGDHIQTGRLTTLGGYRLAMKTLEGYASSVDAIEMLEVGKSPQTAWRWEMLLNGNLLLATRDFYDASDTHVREVHTHSPHEAHDSDSQAPVSWEIHRIMGDATNATATRSLKAHVVQLCSVFRVGIGDTDDDGGDASTIWSHTSMPDLALVPPKCRGLHTRALYHRQMTHTGLKSWLLSKPHKRCHLRVFLWITDAGPDQKECCQLICKEVAMDMYTLTHHDFCVLHQLALIVKYQCDRVVAYLRKLCTLTNTWRTSGTAWKIRTEWTRLFGAASSQDSCGKLPQRALKGRWGYIEDAEEFYINLDPEQLAQVFAAVWPPDTQAKPKRRSATALEQAVDGVYDDELDYKEKVGRWIRESIDAVNDQAFWAQLHVEHYSRAPIAHAVRAVQTNNSMLHLVSHVVPSVMAHIDALLNDDMAVCWRTALHYTPEDSHHDILADIVCNIGTVTCNFIRRVRQPCDEFPRLFSWLTIVPQGKQNDFIAEVCGRLCEQMRLAQNAPDQFTLKVWTWFQTELRACAETGVVPFDLHAFIADVNGVWVVDSQYVEGCNGTLKKVVTHAPNIGLPMISTRTTTKRLLGLTKTEADRASSRRPGDNLQRWADKEEQAKACAARHADPAFRVRLDHLIIDQSRWAVLDPSDTPLDEYAPAPSPTVMTKADRQAAATKGIDQQFAAEMLCALKDLFKVRSIQWLPSGRVALETVWAANDGGDAGAEYWMASLTYYSQVWMIKCDFEVLSCMLCITLLMCVRVM